MFDMPIILYLFLGGTGSGVCLVLAILGFFVPQEEVSILQQSQASFSRRILFRPSRIYQTLFMPAYGSALIVMFIGMMCLIVDLGRADRLLLLMVSPTLSHIAIGAYTYSACFVLSLALTLAWVGQSRSVSLNLVRVLQILCILTAVAAMVYTGLLLQSLRAVPLWSTIWIPVLFILSSASCGIAVVVGVAHFGKAGLVFSSLFNRIILSDAIIIILEGCVVVAFLLFSSHTIGSASGCTIETAIASYETLILGENAQLWWIGFIVMGLVVPLVLEIILLQRNTVSRGLALAISAGVLFGGFVMRFCIVHAGMHPSLAFVAG